MEYNESGTEVNVAREKVFPALKDTLFFVMCILQSAICVFYGFQVIDIIFAVFMWKVCERAHRGIMDVNGMRNLSGAVYAAYIVTNVTCIILTIGVFFTGYLIASSPWVFEEEFVTAIAGDFFTRYDPETLLILFMTVGLLSVAVDAVMNIFGFKRIHRFARSVYRSLERNDLKFIGKARSAVIWLAVYAVLSAATGLLSGSVITIISAVCRVTVTVLAIVLIKKYIRE